MDYKTATDRLAERVTHEDLAEALGVSVNAVRAARLDPGTDSHRTPPEGWERAVAQLARTRAAELEELAAELER